MDTRSCKKNRVIKGKITFVIDKYIEAIAIANAFYNELTIKQPIFKRYILLNNNEIKLRSMIHKCDDPNSELDRQHHEVVNEIYQLDLDLTKLNDMYKSMEAYRMALSEIIGEFRCMFESLPIDSKKTKRIIALIKTLLDNVKKYESIYSNIDHLIEDMDRLITGLDDYEKSVQKNIADEITSYDSMQQIDPVTSDSDACMTLLYSMFKHPIN